MRTKKQELDLLGWKELKGSEKSEIIGGLAKWIPNDAMDPSVFGIYTISSL